MVLEKALARYSVCAMRGGLRVAARTISTKGGGRFAPGTAGQIMRGGQRQLHASASLRAGKRGWLSLKLQAWVDEVDGGARCVKLLTAAKPSEQLQACPCLWHTECCNPSGHAQHKALQMPSKGTRVSHMMRPAPCCHFLTSPVPRPGLPPAGLSSARTRQEISFSKSITQ